MVEYERRGSRGNPPPISKPCGTALEKGTFSAAKGGADDPEVADVVTARRLSAELNGLALLRGEFLGKGSGSPRVAPHGHVSGEAAAAMVRDWLTAQGLNCSRDVH
jgi:hypothetical protein